MSVQPEDRRHLISCGEIEGALEQNGRIVEFPVFLASAPVIKMIAAAAATMIKFSNGLIRRTWPWLVSSDVEAIDEDNACLAPTDKT